MKRWLLMTAPFLLMAITAGAALRWDFSDVLGPRERSFADMRVESVASAMKKIDLHAIQKGPFRAAKSLAMLIGGVKKKAGEDALNVALIVISDKKSIALVDGMLLSTGDSINGLRVKKIEKDRVLFAGKNKFWKYLENR